MLTRETVSLEGLFQPLQVGSLTLANRFVMSAMSRGLSPGNLLPPEAAAYYARRSRGGLGLVVTEAVAIPHPVAAYSTRNPDLSPKNGAGWRAVTTEVHAAGGRIMAQLWHNGLHRDAGACDNGDEPSIAPSLVEGYDVRAMTERDIADVIAAYGAAAVAAQAMGFDGIEVHGGHGYLPDQFFWAHTNRRQDRYGGSIENRTRFAAELVAEIRRRTGPTFPIMFRLSQWKQMDYGARVAQDPDELLQWTAPLAEAGVDLFDCSQRRFWEPEFEGSDLNLAGWVKKLTGKPTMTVGSIGIDSTMEVKSIAAMDSGQASLAQLRRLAEMFDRGDFDLVAVGRMTLTNPDWPQLVRRGDYDAIKPFDPAVLGALQ